MNPVPDINLSSSGTTIQLTVPQIISIFEQAGYHGAQVAPHTQIFVQLEPSQLGTSFVAIPLPSLNYPSPTVEFIISATPITTSSRINQNFIKNMANQLEMTEQELLHIIQSPESGNITEMTNSLNQIFGDLISPPLTENEVRQLIWLK